MTSLRSPDPFLPVFHWNLKLLSYASIPSQGITSIGSFSFLPPKMNWVEHEQGKKMVGRHPAVQDMLCTSGEGMCKISFLVSLPFLQELCNAKKLSYLRKGRTHIASI